MIQSLHNVKKSHYNVDELRLHSRFYTPNCLINAVWARTSNVVKADLAGDERITKLSLEAFRNMANIHRFQLLSTEIARIKGPIPLTRSLKILQPYITSMN